MVSRGAILGLGVLIGLVASCRTGPWAPPDWAEPDPAPPPGEPVDEPAEVRAEELMPLTGRSAVFAVDPDNPAVGAVEVHLEQQPAHWRIRVGGLYETHLLREADGALRARTEIDHEENVRVEYDPPILLLPEVLRVGEPVTDRTHMVIRNRRTGAVRQQGPCKVTVELVHRREVRTPAGTMQAWVVRTVREADLGLADFRVVITEAYVPQRGLVAKHTDRVVRLLRAVPQRTVEHLLLMPPDPADAQPVQPPAPVDGEPASD